MNTFSIVRGVLLAGVVAVSSGGCSGEGPAGPLDDAESVGTVEQPISLGPETFDPPACTKPSTSCFNMHCCPNGMAMTGGHFGKDILRCQAITGANDAACVIQRDVAVSEGVSMRACSPGFYMKGFSKSRNEATCCPLPGGPSLFRTLDGHGEAATLTTDRWMNSPWPWAGTCSSGTMHACPSTMLIEGLHLDLDAFLCAP